jgi:hypothetical protein
MVIVLVENSGVSHITLAAPIKLMGALGLKIKLNTFLGTPPKVDTPIRLGMVFINTNDYGNHT